MGCGGTRGCHWPGRLWAGCIQDVTDIITKKITGIPVLAMCVASASRSGRTEWMGAAEAIKPIQHLGRA
jgi:hypothetical protein